MLNQGKNPVIWTAVFPGVSLGVTEAAPAGIRHAALHNLYTIPKQRAAQQGQMSGFVF